jgi:hypothetical protein
VDYDSEYRRQYCRERIAAMGDEYRRVQPSPRNKSQPRQRVGVARIWSIWERARRQAAQRAPAYRS